MATRETTRTATEVAESYFGAVSARDADAMAAHWSADGVDDLVPVGILRGPEEVRAAFRELFTAIPDLDFVVDRITAGDRVAAVQWRASGTHTGGPYQGIEPTGRRVDLRGCDCIEIDGDGLLVRNTAYYDGAAFARAEGLLPPKDSGAEKAMLRAFNAATKARRAIGERLGR